MGLLLYSSDDDEAYTTSSHHYHHEVYVKNCALRENAHGLIAEARTPWQLFNTVSRGEHEATNCQTCSKTPPAINPLISDPKFITV